MDLPDQLLIESFLQARAVLPSPDGYPKCFVVVWVGPRKPYDSRILYLKMDTEDFVFYFYKEWYPKEPEGWQWVCTDLLLQELVHRNRKEAIKLVDELNIQGK